MRNLCFVEIENVNSSEQSHEEDEIAPLILKPTVGKYASLQQQNATVQELY